jgi:hypothetical protein
MDARVCRAALEKEVKRSRIWDAAEEIKRLLETSSLVLVSFDEIEGFPARARIWRVR